MHSRQPLPIYVINLDRATARWQRTSAGLAAEGLEAVRVAAVDAAAGAHLPVSRYDDAAALRFQGIAMKPGAVGCFASHHLLWQRIVESGQPALVLEDDLEIQPGFAQALTLGGGLIERYSYIRLAALNRRRKHLVLRDLGQGYRLARLGRRPMGTQAYLLSPAGARRLLDHAKRWYEPVDDFIDAFWRHQLAPYAILPFRVDHVDAGQSYVQGDSGVIRRSLGGTVRYRLNRRLDAARARLWLWHHKGGRVPPRP